MIVILLKPLRIDFYDFELKYNMRTIRECLHGLAEKNVKMEINKGIDFSNLIISPINPHKSSTLATFT